MNPAACPFCGSTRLLAWTKEHTDIGNVCQIECRDCQASGPVATEPMAVEARGTHRTLVDYAWALWNRRHIDRRGPPWTP